MIKRLFILVCWINWQCQDARVIKCAQANLLLNEARVLLDTATRNPEKAILELPRFEDRLSNCNQHVDSTHNKILRTIGDIFTKCSEYDKAIEYYQKSIDITEKHLNDPSVNPQHLITAYYNLFLLNNSLNRITEKMNALDSCALISIRLNRVGIHCLYSLYTRGEYAFHVGDYHRCIENEALCEKLAIKYSNRGTAKEESDGLRYASSSLEWQINALLVLRQLDSAKEIIQKRISEFSGRRLRGKLGDAYGFLGDVYLYDNKYDEALPHYLKSLEYYDSAFKIDKDSNSSFNSKSTLSLVGYRIYFKHLKDEKKALEYLEKALKYPVTTENAHLENILESLSILDRIGNIYAAKGEYDHAMQYYQKAFDQIEPGISESYFLQPTEDAFLGNKRRGHIASLLFDKAEALRNRYNSTRDTNSGKQAIQSFKVADQFLEKIKTEQTDLKSKLFWRSDRRKLYESAIDACFATGDAEDAFYFFERSRAVLLYDQLREQRLLSREDLIKQASLQKQVARLEKELASAAKTKELEIQQQRIQAKSELDKINSLFEKRNPLYSQGYFDVGKDLLKVTQGNLAKEKASLIEFFDGDSAVYSIILDSSRVLLYKINKNEFDSAVRDYLAYLSDKDRLNQNFDRFVNTSNRLYQMIFGENAMPAGRIIVSPDSRYFPFEALLTNTSKESPGYLLDLYPISYTHSANFLSASVKGDANVATESFLGIAPVRFDPALARVSLPGSDQSLNELKSEIGNSKNMTFKHATKANFLKQFGEYEVIQLYTHASAGRRGEEPEIYFSDSVLYLSELISEKKTKTRLIVLSACETGAGNWYRGEGVFSFNRGFAALGVSSSVTNLWSVEDKSTYRLTELFYKYLIQGLSLDVALQKAKLEFRANGSGDQRLPYHWAAAILTGATQPIQLTKQSFWESWLKGIALIVSVAMLFAVWINYKKIRSKSFNRKISPVTFS